MFAREQHNWAGWGSGMLGVLIFSASLPATRVAVQELSPVFLTSMRATIAALLGAGLLFLLRSERPQMRDLASIVIVALGVVIGFPLLTALALQHITSAHSLVFIGLLPLTTALFGVLLGAERPKIGFWLFATLGALIIVGFAFSQRGASDSNLIGNLLMIAAIVLCGLGYSQGAVLTKRLGGWQVISWALFLALPMMALLSFATFPNDLGSVSSAAWFCLVYVAIFSMMVGFIFWYRGLAVGGISRVGQLQLLQPFLGLFLAAFFLNESVSLAMIICCVAVVACVAGSKRFA